MYDREILRFLIEAGRKGISINKLSKHVFNASNSFFDVISLEDVHRYVASFLKKHSNDSSSLIERTERRGYYRINLKAKETSQMMLDFNAKDTADNEQETKSSTTDMSLSLFD